MIVSGAVATFISWARLCGHQRELVDRQRPGHAARDDEGRALGHVAALNVLHQAVELLVEEAVVDRQRLLVAWDAAAPP